MLLTKAKSAHSCDMGVGLILPVDAPFHVVVDVILLEIPDVCAQHCITSIFWIVEAGLMSSKSFLEASGCDTYIGLHSLRVLCGHCALVLNLVNCALVWKGTLTLVPAVTGVLLCLLWGIQDLVVVL